MEEGPMKRIVLAVLCYGVFGLSQVMAQDKVQEHKHEQHQEQKKAPGKKDMPMKGEMEKMKEKMKDMNCCAKEEAQKEHKH
jgi:hypothetical protein